MKMLYVCACVFVYSMPVCLILRITVCKGAFGSEALAISIRVKMATVHIYYIKQMIRYAGDRKEERS